MSSGDRIDHAGIGVNPAADHVIVLWHGANQQFGQLGHPQRAVNILGHVEPADTVRSLTWILNGRASGSLSIGPDGKRLHSAGDFNVEIDRDHLKNGQNILVLTAQWENGRHASTQATIDYCANATCSLPYRASWIGDASTGDEWRQQVQIVDGRWNRTPHGLRTRDPHYDRLLTFGDMTWTDYQTRATLAIHRFVYDAPGQLGGGVGLLHRWSGHVPDGNQPRREWRPNGAIGWYRAHWEENPATWRSLNISDAVVEDREIVATGPTNLDLDRDYVFEFSQRSRQGQPGLYRFRVWPADSPTSLNCDLTATARQGEAPAGSVLLIALFADVTVSSVDITAMPTAEQ